jgi:AraC family transcriptional regulator of adaptative response/methylated-DNA-[protein]-cysteine methyltransferase
MFWSPPKDPQVIEEATHDKMYEGIRLRDRSLDGSFFYSVKTTGVYCRPSCAARLANRQNVSFHASAKAAEAAGFRACKRCKPDAMGNPDPQAEAVARACRLIETSEEAPALEPLAKAAGLSPFHFHRVFKKITGVTPKAYADGELARRLAAGLPASRTVMQAIYEAGYNAPSRFYETSPARLGMTPSAFRKGGAGTAIRFAVAMSSLGALLVASTDRGICAILLGDDPDELVRDLQDRFPQAELHGGDAEFERTVAQVIGLVEAPAAGLDLPLDIRGTAFQQQVWQALRAIPPGRTASYAEIAAAIGRPSATRAVARACAGNALAVAIPCHRVVRTNGDISGYRWGVERKRELLAREQTSA